MSTEAAKQPASNKWIYIVRANRADMLQTGPTEAEMAVIGRHRAFIQDQSDAGVVLFVGRTLTTGPETFGIALFQAEDEAAARALVNADPAVEEGVMHAELFPFMLVGLRAPA